MNLRINYGSTDVLQMGCKRCSGVSAPFYKLHPFITILGYSDVSGVMKGKVENAQRAVELDANRDKVCACAGVMLRFCH